MISNIFKVKGLNVHLGYDMYSDITTKCIEQGAFTFDDMFSAAIVSSYLYPNKNKKAKKKIYKAICNYLENISEYSEHVYEYNKDKKAVQTFTA